jgi:predicted membrane-bound dolichyl-phosphate-mannose-protein mannosyltransferase
VQLKTLVEKYGIVCIILIILFLHFVVISFPRNATVFDEVYYVQSAKDSLTLNATNLEHTPLSKLMYGISILTLGDNSYGWRAVPVLCSVLSLYVVFLLARRYTSTSKALLASTLLGFETLFFVNTSIAILEAPAILFSLLGLLLFLSKSYKSSALIFGLAFLCKETTLLIPIAILIYKLVSQFKFKTSYIKPVVLFVSIFLITSLGGLALYDVTYHPTLPSGRVLSNPVDNIFYITSYFGSTTERTWNEAVNHRPAWTWILPFPETFNPPIYRYDTVYTSSHQVLFNVTWTSMQSLPIAFMFLPLIGVCLFNIKKGVKTYYSILSISLLLTTYVPWLFFGTKLLFNYYFLLTIPFICLSMPLLWDAIPNRKMRIAFIAIQLILTLVLFIYYFPINLVGR